MLVDCFRVEFVERGIHSTVAIPGIVDTALMQGALEADPGVFPDRAEYASFADSGRLIDPSRVGRFYAWLLTSTSDGEYDEREWDIRDESHHEHWLGDDPLFGLRADER